MNQKLLKFLFLYFFLFSILLTVNAQYTPANVSSVKVDALSDEQVMQLLQQGRSQGLNDEQIITQAQSGGLPPTEAAKLRTRIAEVRRRGASGSTDSMVTTSRRLNYRPDTIGHANRPRGLYPAELPVYGADLFTNSDIRFEPNLKLATPVNYILGPEDQLNISVYGHSLANWKLEVSSEGNINIPGSGVLNVTGKTIEQATSAVKSKLMASNYAIGRGTSVQVTLGNIRSIKVIMVGQLLRPGTYTLPSLATVFNALYAAGGPNNNGSLREIEVIRNNRVVKRLDVYDFLVRGDQRDNIRLQDQDIIRVPTYRTRVDLNGEIKVPAKFEVLPGESLQTIIGYAGGFTDSAFTARIKVSQIYDQQRRITDVAEADFKNYIPLRGDQYFVETVLNRFQNRVVINGAVFRPGVYELEKGLTLARLITKAVGLKEDAFMSRATITRLKPDNTTEILAFNVHDIVTGAQNIVLQREDVINIASIFDLRDRYQVSINGFVRRPGTYAYADSMRVEDLVFIAGGFAAGASSTRIEVARRISDADPLSKNTKIATVFTVNADGKLTAGQANFVLRPFDIVSVFNSPGYEKQRTVRVEGEVLYAGTYTIQNKNEKISDLVNRAGGLTPLADVSGSTLKRDYASALTGGEGRADIDTNEVVQDREQRLSRLRRISNDTSSVYLPRNNYVGIDLEKILKHPGSEADLLLENNDVLRVPKTQQIVHVNGEVLYPSAIVHQEGKSFKSYVDNAGGFSPYALKRSSYVLYPNGTVKATHRFLWFKFYPAVRAGSEIYVPRKPVRRGNTLQEILGLTTGLASIGAIILGIISLHK